MRQNEMTGVTWAKPEAIETDEPPAPGVRTMVAITQEMLAALEAKGVLRAGQIARDHLALNPNCEWDEIELKAIVFRIAVFRGWPIEFGD
jgi:hypothetical protein